MHLLAGVVLCLMTLAAACGGSDDANDPASGGDAAATPLVDAAESSDAGGLADADPILLSDALPGDAMTTPVPAVCLGVACGEGSCVAGLEGPQCECKPRFSGDRCDTCARGYTGAGCAACVDGYVDDGNGNCISDPCEELTCQNGNSCVNDRAGLRCDCRANFTGDSCERCAQGYTGGDCSMCANGYQRVDLQCVPNVCFNVECGYGQCKDMGGQPMCSCKTGATGDKCDECIAGYSKTRDGACANILPSTGVVVRAWFDASQPGTMELTDAGDVRVWRSRNNADIRFRGHYTMDQRLPRYSSVTRGVVFDGDVMVAHSDIPGQLNHYAVYGVVRWNKAAGRQVLFRTYPVKGEGEGPGISFNNDGVSFLHRVSGAGDLVEGKFYSDANPLRMFVAKRQPLLNGTAQVVANGNGQQTLKAATQGALTDQHLMVMGMQYPGADLKDNLKGTVHEVIWFGGVLTAAQETAVFDYLKVKWGL